MEPICVEGSFEAYTDELQSFARQHDIKLPSLQKLGGQALALLSHPANAGVRYANREIATNFFTKIGMVSNDTIQPFNKIEQIGIALTRERRGHYTVKYPFEYCRTHVEKRKNMDISEEGKADFISLVKKWWLDNLVNVPDEQWQKGHLDPDIPDSSSNNLAWQPPIQGKARDRFKFSAIFGERVWPTVKELLPNFSKYYSTKEERHKIYMHLKAEFEP